MPKAVTDRHIVIDKNVCGGKPRIAGSRIKVQQIILEYERLGWTADEVCDAHPSLSLADVHAALAYYYDHAEEIEKDIREDDEFIDRLKKSPAE